MRNFPFPDYMVSQLEDVLRRGGFVPCDIPACNCGSWHARFGLPERWDEIKEDLAEAGHPLSNANGNLVRKALAKLVEERDALQASLLKLYVALCSTDDEGLVDHAESMAEARRLLRPTPSADAQQVKP